MKKRLLYIFLAVIVLVVSAFTIFAYADAGGFSGDTDYGGGYDYGSSSDYGSSDYGDGDYGALAGSITDLIILTSGDSGIPWGLIAVGVIWLLVVRSKNKKTNAKSSATYADYVPKRSTQTNLRPMLSLRELDPNFSEAEMRERIANLYIRIQQAWQSGDFEPMRPYFTDVLYSQFAQQLNAIVRAGRTNYIDRIAVLAVRLDGWTQDEINDCVIATVQTRIVDYTLENSTGKLISGSQTAEKFMTYQYTMVRSKGMTTPEKEGNSRDGTVRITCPSCSAPLAINQNAKCPYCGSIINSKDYDWSIAAIQGISQRTAGS